MSFLDVLLGGYKRLQVGGVSQPTEPTLNLVAGTGVTIANVDDSANTRSSVTISLSGANSGGQALTAANFPFTVPNLAGSWLYTVTGLSAPVVFKLPLSSSAPAPWMSVEVLMGDTSLTSTNTITVNGNGYDIVYNGVSASTLVLTPALINYGGLSFTLNGTVWVAN